MAPRALQVYHDLLRVGDGSGEGMLCSFFNTIGWPATLATSEQDSFVATVLARKARRVAALVAAGLPLRAGAGRCRAPVLVFRAPGRCSSGGAASLQTAGGPCRRGRAGGERAAGRRARRGAVQQRRGRARAEPVGGGGGGAGAPGRARARADRRQRGLQLRGQPGGRKVPGAPLRLGGRRTRACVRFGSCRPACMPPLRCPAALCRMRYGPSRTQAALLLWPRRRRPAQGAHARPGTGATTHAAVSCHPVLLRLQRQCRRRPVGSPAGAPIRPLAPRRR